MPETTHVYCGDRERHYPYPPIMRVLKPGDEIDLDPAEVPEDVPLRPKAAAPRRKTPAPRRKPRTAAAAQGAETPTPTDGAATAGDSAGQDPADPTPDDAAGSGPRSDRAPKEVDR